MWEYKVLDDLYGLDLLALAASLDEEGAEGWELVSVNAWHSDQGFEHTRYFFRRRKAEV